MTSILANIVLGLFFSASVAFASSGSSDIDLTTVPQVVEKSRPYVVEIIEPDGTTQSVTGISNGANIDAVLATLKLPVYSEDRTTVFPEIKMGIGGKITLNTAPVYTLIDGKKTSTIRSWQPTIGEILTENGVEMGDDDKINFSLDTEAISGMEIRITRVARTTVKESQQIDFKTVKKEDKTVDEGKIIVQQKGVKGEKLFYYLVIREDGVQISKTLTKTETATEPTEEIQIIGTKPVITVACGSRADIKGWILEAGLQYGVKPNSLCTLMMKESRGNPNSVGGDGAYNGLFQYEAGFWNRASSSAGYASASIFDAKAQIFSTAWAWSHGLRSRWPAD
ncbi:MAG: G5 domain-containing protein [bacterium]